MSLTIPKIKLTDMQEKLKKTESSSNENYNDDRFWKLSKDQNRNGAAIIRFIPDKEGTPYVKIYEHFFPYVVNGQKKMFVSPCPTTIGKPCPICEKNVEYWNSTFESDKDIARQRKRRTIYISNIYIIKHKMYDTDKKQGEDEGKVFLFRYGKQIFKKIYACIFPPKIDDLDDDSDVKAFVPFDLFEGADFKLISAKGDMFENYDTSSFKEPSPFLNGNEKEIAKVIEQTYNLNDFLKEEYYPTYEEIVKKLYPLFEKEPLLETSSIKSTASSKLTKQTIIEDLEEEEFVLDDLDKKKKSSTKSFVIKKEVIDEEDDNDDSDDSDDEEFFNKI